MKYHDLRQFAVDIAASINDKYVCDTITFEEVNALYLLLPKHLQKPEILERIINRGYQLGISIRQIVYLVKSLFYDVQS